MTTIAKLFRPEYSRLAEAAVDQVVNKANSDIVTPMLSGIVAEVRAHLDDTNHISDDEDRAIRAGKLYLEGDQVLALVLLRSLSKHPDPNLPPREYNANWRPQSMAIWFCAKYCTKDLEHSGTWLLKGSLIFAPSIREIEAAKGKVIALLAPNGSTRDRMIVFPDYTTIHQKYPGRQWIPRSKNQRSKLSVMQQKIFSTKFVHIVLNEK